jgi:hypothetical protein
MANDSPPKFPFEGNAWAYVTQEMWDNAQKALRNVLPLVEANVPALSTDGTAISLRDEVRAAIVGAPADTSGEPK